MKLEMITVIASKQGVEVALLRNSGEGRVSPFPGQTHATRCVTGVPMAVKRLSTATRM